MVTRFRLAGEAGQVPEGEIHPESTGPATVVVDPFAEILRQVARVYQAGKEEFRIQVGHDRPCGQRGSVFQNDAAGAPFFGQDFTHRGVGPERDASLAAGGSHGLGNGTHSADGMSPGALLAIHLTKQMVQQDIGAAGRVGARIIADDTVETEQGLDRGAFKPAVQPVTGGFGEQVQQVALGGHGEAAQLRPQPGGLEEVGQGAGPSAFVQIGRALQDEAAQRVRNGLKA